MLSAACHELWSLWTLPSAGARQSRGRLSVHRLAQNESLQVAWYRKVFKVFLKWSSWPFISLAIFVGRKIKSFQWPWKTVLKLQAHWECLAWFHWLVRLQKDLLSLRVLQQPGGGGGWRSQVFCYSPLHSQLLVDSLACDIYPGHVEHYEVSLLRYLSLPSVWFGLAVFILPTRNISFMIPFTSRVSRFGDRSKS